MKTAYLIRLFLLLATSLLCITGSGFAETILFDTKKTVKKEPPSTSGKAAPVSPTLQKPDQTTTNETGQKRHFCQSVYQYGKTLQAKMTVTFLEFMPPVQLTSGYPLVGRGLYHVPGKLDEKFKSADSNGMAVYKKVRLKGNKTAYYFYNAGGHTRFSRDQDLQEIDKLYKANKLNILVCDNGSPDRCKVKINAFLWDNALGRKVMEDDHRLKHWVKIKCRQFAVTEPLDPFEWNTGHFDGE